MVAQIRVTKTGVGIGLCGFGEQAGAKAPILLAGREAKGFKAALEQAMREAGLAQGDWARDWRCVPAGLIVAGLPANWRKTDILGEHSEPSAAHSPRRHRHPAARGGQGV